MKGHSLQTGLSHEFSFTIPENKTVPHLYPESQEFAVMPNVLATGYMLGLFEWACIQAIKPYIDWPHEQTVGTHVNLSHEAATPPGLTVTVKVRLEAVEGRKLSFSIVADDGIDKISEGTHERVIINVSKFNEKGKAKAERASRQEGGATTDRKEVTKITGAAAATDDALSTPWMESAAQAGGRINRVKALAFDAYGTLFDVFSVTALCEQLFPGKGNTLAQLWRSKQLQYSLLRSLMGRYKDFWQLTQDGLVFASKNLKLDLTHEKRKRLMEAYLNLAAFPDVKPGLEGLKQEGVALAILSNGDQRMLESAAKSAGIFDLFDTIISVEEVRIYKVSPRVYDLGPRRMNVTNAELGFVSSNSWDINGAASAGLVTFWIQRSVAELPEELGFGADGVVSAITELAPLLQRRR